MDKAQLPSWVPIVAIVVIVVIVILVGIRAFSPKPPQLPKAPPGQALTSPPNYTGSYKPAPGAQTRPQYSNTGGH